MRVTDLEKFALDQIYRPYWLGHPANAAHGWGGELKRLPFDLDATAAQLRESGEWQMCVIGRLAAIGVTFPSYIQHPLVTVLRELMDAHDATKQKENAK